MDELKDNLKAHRSIRAELEITFSEAYDFIYGNNHPSFEIMNIYFSNVCIKKIW